MAPASVFSAPCPSYALFMPRHVLLALLLLLGAGCFVQGQAPDPAARTAAVSRDACAPGAPAGYSGPCYYGALPVFFDDFTYTSDQLPATAPNSGSVYGRNAWVLRDDTVQTRGWFRYNRDDHPFSGEAVFEGPSILTLRIPAGLPAEDFTRDPNLHGATALAAGTYHWRVRFSPQWEGQGLRQTVWLISPAQYYFDHLTPHDSTRYAWASELDFENENHFHGERIGGRLYPDYSTRLAVTNLLADVIDERGQHRASYEGPEVWSDEKGVLARIGPGPHDFVREAPQAVWADRWVHLILVMDDAARTVTYRMVPEDLGGPNDPLRAVAERAVTMSPDYYPFAPVSPMFAVHWVNPEGRLRNDLRLDVDWFYHTPGVGLSDHEVLRQVALLRERGLPRVNTTGRPTFVPFDQAERLTAVFDGPAVAACGRPATWLLRPEPGGNRVAATFRYRILATDGGAGSWRTLYRPMLTLTPRPGQAGVELEGTVQDVWKPHGPRTLPNGWIAPHPDNYAAPAQRTVRFDCGG